MTSESPWIDFACSKIGVWHDGPDVRRIASEIADRFPEMRAYSKFASLPAPEHARRIEPCPSRSRRCRRTR
jgi:hypothetical protein